MATLGRTRPRSPRAFRRSLVVITHYEGRTANGLKILRLLRQVDSCAGRRRPRLRSPWFPYERVRRGLAEQEVTAPPELPPEAHNGDKPAKRAN
jgi:hypothetical protein